MNLPIYRAKKIDTNKYIQGYLLGMWGEYFISWGETNHVPNKVQIDPLTLAVHFKDMVDSEGSKIFASLSKDGKGGAILDISGRTETLFIEEAVIQTYMFKWDDLKDFKKKAIGIQE